LNGIATDFSFLRGSNEAIQHGFRDTRIAGRQPPGSPLWTRFQGRENEKVPDETLSRPGSMDTTASWFSNDLTSCFQASVTTV